MSPQQVRSETNDSVDKPPARHWFRQPEGSDAPEQSAKGNGPGPAAEAMEAMDAQAGRGPRYGADTRAAKDQPGQVSKPDGTLIQYRDGVISTTLHGATRVDYEYERDAAGIKHDAKGQAVLKSAHINDGGRVFTLDATNCPNLQDRARVAQSGAQAGNIELKSPDGSITTILTTDQSVYQLGTIRTADGKTTSHILSAEKNDAAGRHGVVFSYDPEHPEILRGVRERTAAGVVNGWQYMKDVQGRDFARLDEQHIGDTTRRFQYDNPNTNQHSVMTETTPQSDGSAHVNTWRRIGDTERFNITKWDGSTEVRDMSPKQEAEHRSHIVFDTLKRHWFDGSDRSAPTGTSLEKSRQLFLDAARRDHLFGGRSSETQRFVNEFESRIKKDRNDRLAAPTDEQMARSYNHLCKMLGYEINHGKLDTEHIAKHKSSTGERNKRLACETALMAVADPLRYVNQANKGTCTLNGVQSLVIHDNPDQYLRMVNSCLDGRVVSRDHKNFVNLNSRQLTPENRYGETYANQLFTAAAVSITNYKLYKDTGDSFPGAGDDAAKQVWHFATGKDTLFIAGQGTPAARVRDWIRRHGGVLYYCPDKPHCESIIGMTRDGRFIQNNSWASGAVVHSDGTPVTNTPLGPEDGPHTARQLGFV